MSSSDASEIGRFVATQEITEVLHFTTNSGLLGILASRYLKSRALLSEDQYLERLYTPNAQYRRDHNWIRYVNLSISAINTRFFTASGRWHAHEDLWWSVLAFSPSILGHADVIFTTTNNIYTGVSRAKGISGLKAMFDEEVLQYGSNVARRYPGMAKNLPTCPQSEVLYPTQVPTEFLERIYVDTSDHAAVAEAQCASVGHKDVEVIVSPAVFGW